MLKSPVRALALLLVLTAFLGFSESKAEDEIKTNIFTELSTEQRILVLGRDNSSGLCDAVMLASFNTSEKSLTLLQIPRDTYVNLGRDNYKKINGAAKVLGGEDKLCALLGNALGVTVDGYISFDTRLVSEIVDAMGGVELVVPCNMDYEDPYQGLSIHLKKGRQTLSGREAVGFVRYRSGYLRADLGRIDAQKIFLAALAKNALRKLEGSRLVAASGAALKYVKTNLPVTALSALALSMKDSSQEKISFVTLPGEEVQSNKSGAWFYILSQKGCEKLLSSAVSSKGFDPDGIFSDRSRAEFEEIYNREIEAHVYNAAEIDGEGINIIPNN